MEPSESMMLRDYSPKSLKLKFSQGKTQSHIDIYTRHQSGASTLSFFGDDSSLEKHKNNKNPKHDSSFSEFPLVRYLLDRLHATSPRTNFASAARAGGQRLPCGNVQDQVRIDRSHSLGRALGGGKIMGTWRSWNSSHNAFIFNFFGRNRWEACGTGDAEQPRKAGNHEAPRGLRAPWSPSSPPAEPGVI